MGLSLFPIVKAEVIYRFQRWRGITYSVDENSKSSSTLSKGAAYFAVLAKEPTPLKIEPLSREFGIIIEKIGVNAPIVADVDSANYEEYMEALRHGVAHAKYTSYPGEAGNSYVHGHSTLNFWQMGKYATVFTLLNKVEVGDRIVTFYKGKRFDYRVVKKEYFDHYDITPILREYSEPTLSVQTCHPPGTTRQRLVLTANLISE